MKEGERRGDDGGLKSEREKQSSGTFIYMCHMRVMSLRAERGREWKLKSSKWKDDSKNVFLLVQQKGRREERRPKLSL